MNKVITGNERGFVKIKSYKLSFFAPVFTKKETITHPTEHITVKD